MNSPEIREYIRKHSSLFWYIPEDKKEDISEDVLVEFILNYGTMEDVKELLRLMGIKEVSEVFVRSLNKSERRQGNYHELTRHYFTLFFERYAH